ncbi:MAG: translation elongation factor Ts [Lawsonella sp.]|nr:elongation factor Ts [Mycobacteriales bacterium]
MANFSAADVKRLRDMTAAGMLDCKKALEETDGDFDKAVELLRIKGAKDIGKRAERATAQGLIASKDGALIELNAETDFVAKNDKFIDLANKIIDLAAAERPETLEDLLALDLDGDTVADAVQNLSAVIGEKMQLRRYARLDGQVATYMHKRSADLPPQVGVIVAYEGDDEEAAHAAAMQIAALRPQYVSREEVPADVVAKEREIAEATAREEGKPEKALPMIVEGRLNGFYKDVCLLDQPSVTDNKKSVGQLQDEAGNKIVGFLRFEVGQN